MRTQPSGLRFVSFIANIGEDLIHENDLGDTSSDWTTDAHDAKHEEMEMLSLHDPADHEPGGIEANTSCGTRDTKTRLTDLGL